MNISIHIFNMYVFLAHFCLIFIQFVVFNRFINCLNKRLIVHRVIYYREARVNESTMR